MATLYGIAIGPVALNLLQLDEWGLGANRLMLPFTRLMIAVQVMVVGVCLPKYDFPSPLSLIPTNTSR